MGLTHVEAVVTGANDRSRTVRLLVDSGAMYAVLPAYIWPDLGLQPIRMLLASSLQEQHAELGRILRPTHPRSPLKPSPEALAVIIIGCEGQA